MFTCEFCEIFKNSFFTEHIRTIASVAGIYLLRARNKDHTEGWNTELNMLKFTIKTPERRHPFYPIETSKTCFLMV